MWRRDLDPGCAAYSFQPREQHGQGRAEAGHAAQNRCSRAEGHGRRAGTENVAGIAGFAAALKVALETLEEDAMRLENLRNRLENGLRQTPGVIVFADGARRLPNTTLFTTPGLKAETAVIGFDLAGVAVSSGSACSSGKVQPSHVLKAMGFGPEAAEGAVRFSLGWSTSSADIDCCLEAWRKLSGTLLRGERRNTA